MAASAAARVSALEISRRSAVTAGCMDFGKSGGGGLWKAIGILYLIGLICFVLAILIGIIAGLTKSLGMLGLLGSLVLIGGLVLLGALICHGIGLITGAGKMSA